MYTSKLFGLGYAKQVGDFIKYLVYSIISVSPAFILNFVNISGII